jgi:hypothetical protein
MDSRKRTWPAADRKLLQEFVAIYGPIEGAYVLGVRRETVYRWSRELSRPHEMSLAALREQLTALIRMGKTKRFAPPK